MTLPTHDYYPSPPISSERLNYLCEQFTFILYKELIHRMSLEFDIVKDVDLVSINKIVSIVSDKLKKYAN